MCKICETHATKIPYLIYESNLFIIRHSEFTKNIPAYLYIEPKRHIENYAEFTDNEFSNLGSIIQKGIEWIYEFTKPKKIYTVTISEKVPHIHFHLVPRFTEEQIGFEYLQKAVSGEMEMNIETENIFPAIKKHFR